MSPSSLVNLLKSIELEARRAGVPVCNLPSLNPALRRESDSPIEGPSFILPAGNLFIPMEWGQPRTESTKVATDQYGFLQRETFRCTEQLASRRSLRHCLKLCLNILYGVKCMAQTKLHSSNSQRLSLRRRFLLHNQIVNTTGSDVQLRIVEELSLHVFLV